MKGQLRGIGERMMDSVCLLFFITLVTARDVRAERHALGHVLVQKVTVIALVTTALDPVAADDSVALRLYKSSRRVTYFW